MNHAHAFGFRPSCSRHAESIPGWTGRTEDRSVLIGALEGEGIGKEVVSAALDVVAAALEAQGVPFRVEHGGKIGLDAFAESGRELSGEVAAFCESVFARGGAILAGAGAGRFVYQLRARFDLYCKLTPVRPLVRSGILRDAAIEGVDILFVRENTGGLYFGTEQRIGAEGRLSGVKHSFGYTSEAIARILRVAVRLSEMRRERLCLIVKPYALRAISELWTDMLRQAVRNSPVAWEVLSADFAAYELINNARRFDVIVSPNMLGDILADCGGLLAGSRGMTFSGNFSDNGIAVFQTGHGAATDLAGKNIANPVGQILSAAMMLREGFNLPAAAAAIETAAAQVLGAGWRTADMPAPGHEAIGTREMADRIAARVALCPVSAGGSQT